MCGNTVDASGAWGQHLKVKGGSFVKVEGYVKTEMSSVGVDGGACFIIDCWDKDWNYLSGYDTNKVYVTTDWVKIGGGWTLFPETYAVNVCCAVKNCVGKATFDDVVFVYG